MTAFVDAMFEDAEGTASIPLEYHCRLNILSPSHSLYLWQLGQANGSTFEIQIYHQKTQTRRKEVEAPAQEGAIPLSAFCPGR